MPKTDVHLRPAQGAAPERSYSGLSMSDRTTLRRRRFVDAGIQLFGTVGFHGTTVRMLTAKAGLTNRYFYESFGSTEDLLVACYQQLTSTYRARLELVLNKADRGLEEKARAGLTCFFESMRDPCFARITHSEVLGISPRVDSIYIETITDFGRLIVDYIMRSVAPVDMDKPGQLDLLGVALAGSLIQTGIVWVRNRYLTPLEVVVSTTLKVILGTAHELGQDLTPTTSLNA